MCARELSSAAHAHVIVTTALNHVLERSEVARKQTGALMHDLVKEKVVTIDDFKKGVADVLEYVEDLEIDIPQVRMITRNTRKTTTLTTKTTIRGQSKKSVS